MTPRPARAAQNGCRVCDTVAPGDLIDLDLLMGDASRWPSSVWGIFNPPKGQLTAGYQRFGAMEMGRRFLAERGYTGIPDVSLRKHYRYDVVVVASSPEDLVNKGLIEAGDTRESMPSLPDLERLDPRAFLTYFNRGIQLGNRGLELIAERIEKMILAGEDPPLSLLTKVAEMGGKLATTQAVLRARGLQVGDSDDADEGFRAGSDPDGLPSQRLGHHRIRTIDGQARPVVDMGAADRARYNEGAAEDGSPRLPAP